jgi:hypothetical protein
MCVIRWRSGRVRVIKYEAQGWARESGGGEERFEGGRY